MPKSLPSCSKNSCPIRSHPMTLTPSTISFLVSSEIWMAGLVSNRSHNLRKSDWVDSDKRQTRPYRAERGEKKSFKFLFPNKLCFHSFSNVSVTNYKKNSFKQQPRLIRGHFNNTWHFFGRPLFRESIEHKSIKSQRTRDVAVLDVHLSRRKRTLHVDGILLLQSRDQMFRFSLTS